MKKTIAFLLLFVLLFCFIGCSKPEEKPVDGTETDTKQEQTSETEETTEKNQRLFDESAPMFLCQDRADIEGDRDTFYYYNYKGEELESPLLKNTGFFAENGLAPARDSLTYKIGFVDQSGVFVIDPQWDDAAAFSKDGVALVILEEENEEGWTEEKYGYINEKGEQIVPCIYDDATSFYPQGVALIAVSEKVQRTETNENGEEETYDTTTLRWGAIDKTGKVIIQPQYERIENVEGDYILCSGEKAQAVYDLSGKVLISEEECEKNQYYFEQECGTLYRWVSELIPEEELEENQYPYRYKDKKIFNGKEFVAKEIDITEPFIRSERVSTTVTGHGYGVVRGNGAEKREDRELEVLIPYEYDEIVRYNSYYVGIKYKDVNKEEQSFDIYNSNFEKTAENIQYKFERYRRTWSLNMYGEYIVLPDGYFEISYYDREMGETLCGIINANGETIVPVMFYRTIKLFVYECVGGKFVKHW